jgi:hypothetical protein
MRVHGRVHWLSEDTHGRNIHRAFADAHVPVAYTPDVLIVVHTFSRSSSRAQIAYNTCAYHQ